MFYRHTHRILWVIINLVLNYGFGFADTITVGPSVELVYVPGGEFEMGSTRDETEKPKHKVSLDGFWIGREKVTIGQYVDFLNEVQPDRDSVITWININAKALCRIPQGPAVLPISPDEYLVLPQPGKLERRNTTHIYYENGLYYAEEGWENERIRNVTWYGAKAFCDYYGLRLPTEAEWEFAANSRDIYNINVMLGMGWEWCSDWYKEYKRKKTHNPQGPDKGEYKVLRGSSGVSVSDRWWGRPYYVNLKYTFRCAADYKNFPVAPKSDAGSE